MSKLILIGLTLLTCCSPTKRETVDKIDSSSTQELPKTKENRKTDNYCFRDFLCREDMQRTDSDTIWRRNIEVLKLKLKLECNREYSFVDTIIFKRNSPCETDSVIYRYIQNTLTIEHTFKNISRTIEITPRTFEDFFEESKLAKLGYIGNNFSISINKNDSSFNITVPVYFQEIDVGEIGTVEIDKKGNIKVKSVERYPGFVPD
jgi:hypothetical protein